MITIEDTLLIIAGSLFAMAGALALVWHYQPKKPEYQKPKSYNREPESEYQNLIDEHTKN